MGRGQNNSRPLMPRMCAEYHENEIMPSRPVHWESMTFYTPGDLTVTFSQLSAEATYRSKAAMFLDSSRLPRPAEMSGNRIVVRRMEDLVGKIFGTGAFFDSE